MAAPGIALGLVVWQGQRGPQKPLGACPGEASGALPSQLAATESCCASQPAQLQHHMICLINPAFKHSSAFHHVTHVCLVSKQMMCRIVQRGLGTT